jgi:lipopolysaccharide/colanic/teichoic acid biosynthesis glycosyltransferase
VKPGITGWAQIRHSYAASVEDAIEKLQYDLYYIKHLSLWLDLLILAETVKTVVRQRGAR